MVGAFAQRAIFVLTTAFVGATATAAPGAAHAQNPPPPGSTVEVVTPVPLGSVPAALVGAMRDYASARFPESYIGYCSEAVAPDGVQWCSGVTQLTETSARVGFGHAFSDYGVPGVTFVKQADGTWRAAPEAPATGSGVEPGGASDVLLLSLAGIVAVILGVGLSVVGTRARPPVAL